MKKASEQPCEILYRTADGKYGESIRKFQGCPSIAVTPKGRIYAAWYSGGRCEPHMENYNILSYSDDSGNTWTQNLLVIPSSLERCVQALDIQLWISPVGTLYVFWVQNNTVPAGEGVAGYTIDGYVFNDAIHAEWFIVCGEPDAGIPVFSEPVYMDMGFLRCKPVVLTSGRWLLFNYDQTNDRYGYSISDDGGKTFSHRYGAKKIPTPFDEAMAYQLSDGSIRMLARTSVGRLAESRSYDDGETWSEAEITELLNPNTRFFISRTPSGRILLINNDHETDRRNMTVYLSEDEGMTWKYKRNIDGRSGVSYPDADFYDGKIYAVYDRERTGAKEIITVCFTEDDITDPSRLAASNIISKP